MKKVAIFDIDGTIFRSSLLIEVVEALIKENIFPSNAKNIYTKDYYNWLNRKSSYEKYITAVVKAFNHNLKGILHSDFVKISKKVIDLQKNRVYLYTRELVKDLKNKKYYIMAISNSPKEILDEFCKEWRFDKVYGRVYEFNQNGEFTGKTLYSDLISDKAKILERAIVKEKLTLKDSVGVGDTESDIPFLKLVKRPICFNPNLQLYQHAKLNKWEIVVERKDVIYFLKDNIK